MPWTWTGTSFGHSSPNSVTGTHAYTKTAPRAPGRVWASICAGRTPSENPRYTTSAGRSRAPAAPRWITSPNPMPSTNAMPDSIESKVRPSNRSGVCTVCPSDRSSSANAVMPGESPRAWWNRTTSAMPGTYPPRLQPEPGQPAPQFRTDRDLRAELRQDADDPQPHPVREELLGWNRQLQRHGELRVPR